jgi:CD22 antigen
VLQGNDDWTVSYPSRNVCALRGATVDISCTYDYPDNVQYRPNTFRTLWFTKGDKNQTVDLEHDTNYTGRVEPSCGEVRCTGSRCHGKCTLRINDLRQNDSAVYKFRFTTNQPGFEYTGDPGVTLSVTGKLGLPMSGVWVCYCLSVFFYCLCVCGCVGSIKFVLFVILII